MAKWEYWISHNLLESEEIANLSKKHISRHCKRNSENFIVDQKYNIVCCNWQVIQSHLIVLVSYSFNDQGVPCDTQCTKFGVKK